MCEHEAVHGSVTFSIEVVAPCGEVCMIKDFRSMREINLINGAKLLKNCRLFFRELGFSGDNWKVKISRISTSTSGSQTRESITEKVFC